MVSQAGGLALGGLLPAVHSFACFLTPRANEQIFNNATEGTKVLYAGTLAGIVPGGPGHSHQSVRDIALMGCVPGMACLEPASDDEARLCVDWAVDEATGPVYIRLVSVPWDLGFEPPRAERLERGRGTVARADGDALFVCTGPVLASQAWQVDGSALVLLPWLRDVDGAWLAEVAGGAADRLLDNHWSAAARATRSAPHCRGRSSRSGASTACRPADPTTRSCARTASTPPHSHAVSPPDDRPCLLGHRRDAAHDRARGHLRARGRVARGPRPRAGPVDHANGGTHGRGDRRRGRPELRPAGARRRLPPRVRAAAARAPAPQARRGPAQRPRRPRGLDARDDAVNLLLTGNIREGAEAKLRHYGLWDFFADTGGAFSVEGSDRPSIARAAQALAGRPTRGSDAYVIGDTPHDVRCGKVIGARTVAVATGPGYTLTELQACDPWVALEQLPPASELLGLLGLAPLT